MKTAYHLTLVVLFPVLAVASFEEIQTDARLYGLAGAGVALSDMTGSDLYNPALPALAGDLSASSGSAIPFGLTDLTAFSGAYAHRKDKMGVGVVLATMGNRLYRENILKGAFSYRLIEKAAVGVSLNCYQLNIERYGSAAGMGLDLGLLGKPAEWLALGMMAANVNRPTIGQNREEISQSLSLGVAVEPSDEITLSFELYCQRDWPSQVRIGQEYRYRNLLALRAGFCDRPNAASLGFGVIYKNLRLDYAVRTHTDLGLSHCLSLNYITQRIFARHEEVRIENTQTVKIIEKIDPNGASFDDLCLLPGIGPQSAADIIAYRDSIGPFKYLDDLAEVRGIGLSMLERMVPYMTLEYKPDIPVIININQASAQELAALPGIGSKTAGDITAYRQENGPFRSLEDIMNVKGIGRKTYEEIKNLITIGP
ncbi:MAG: helix-hairpin-helix domain-containing protein [Candidatus Edwardsbacteria bacterium]|nr:helix-hairpin-helix domain-containing protein [Candidatus Edwardsbacteria bacterium]MBU1576508.1 helix-hairpin-helix domain-containing protein [Candidatus Edwardsbacteria bacterium]MBU2462726.1 helix-hairpin-helix domain-containing protein [Candidatus Edwardsbacteria bacterium]MBU2594412.1 helix-hairpin-helix domain-containing protein [Candidatus Edwardsbacteria bacterium]